MQAMSALFHIPQQEPPTLSTPGWSSDFSDFLSHALVLDPDERWTATQLLTVCRCQGCTAMDRFIPWPVENCVSHHIFLLPPVTLC